MQQLPNLSTLTSFLKQKQKLTTNPSYTSDVRQLLMSLNSQTIDSIKQQFHANDNQITLQKFLWLVKNSFPNQPSSHLIYYQLTKLFQDIDIDGSNTIEWPQFLEYLSSSNMISIQNNIEGNRVNSEKKILFQADKEEIKYRKHPIKKIIEICRNNIVAVVNHDHLLEFINYEQKDSRGKAFCINHIDERKVLSLDYAEEQRIFGVLMVNRNICFVDDGQIQKQIGVIRPSGTQNDIKYLKLHKLWAVLSHNSSLQLFPSPKTTSIPNKIIFKPHEEPLTGVEQIKTPQAICTASLDGSIKLWNPEVGKLIIQLSAGQELGLRGEDQKGVKGIATFSEGNVSYICSWMFTSQLFVWMPSLSLSKPYIGELKGHLGLVLDCAFSWKGEVISLDDKRSVRVWNAQKLQCNQILTTEQNTLKLFVLKSRPYLAAYAKVITFFRIKTDSKADLQMEMGLTKKGQRNVLARGEITQSTLIGTIFSKYYSSLVVATSLYTKILDINTPKVRANFLPPRQDEQFTNIVQKTDRYFFISTSKGNIFQHKIQDGAITKMIAVTSSPDQQLKFIHYNADIKILMAVVEGARCSNLLTFDEEIFQGNSTIKEIQFQLTNLLIFRYSQKQHKFFILNQNYLTIWSYSRFLMLNKIHIKKIGVEIVIDMLIEDDSGSIVLIGQNDVFVVRMDQCYGLWECVRLETGRVDREMVVGGSLLKKDVHASYLQQVRINTTTKGLSTLQTVKTTTFKTKGKYQDLAELSSVNIQSNNKSIINPTVPTYILMLANSKGEIYFHNVTSHFPFLDFEYDQPKGNLHKIKEKRKSFIKQETQVEVSQKIDLRGEMFTERTGFVHKASECGNINGYFYVFNDFQALHMMDIYGTIIGEWNTNLPDPKRWSFNYNQMDLILQRLEMTQKALKRIIPINSTQFKVELLMTKYMQEENYKELKRYTSKSIGSSNKILGGGGSSKNSIKLNDQLPEGNMNTIVSIAGEAGRRRDNLFVKKFSQYKQNIKGRKVSHQFCDRIQKVVKDHLVREEKRGERERKGNSFEHSKDKVSPLLEKLDQFFPGAEFNTFTEHPTDTASAKQKKKDLRRQSLVQRPRTSTLTPSKPALKSRIKSSMTNLTKNFTQHKIEYRNFVQRNAQILASTQKILKKKGQLKL